MSYYKNRHKASEEILKEMIELLPSSYNKEVDDTNYYKLLRALSYELADAKIDIQQIKDNTYLETVTSDLMYNNFGVLVKLRKDPEWSEEKYRHLIKGITQSLFKGPTKKSLIDSFKLFSNFKVNIHELYKDYKKIDPTIYEGYNPMFTFILEIEKPIDEIVDQQALDKDSNYVINIIKPAHTLTINIVTLVGEENYKKYYRIDKILGKEIQDTFDNKILAEVNKRIEQRFFDEARDYSLDNNVDLETATNILRNQSNGIDQEKYDQQVREISERLLQAHLSSSTTCTPVRNRPIEYFIEIAKESLRNTKFENEPSRITLDLKYYRELRDEIFNNANIMLTKEKIYLKVIEKQSVLIEEWESIGKNKFDKSDSEWYYESLDALKEQYLKDFIITELGGQDKLWKKTTDEVEFYRIILETNLENTVPYCGMDQMESEANLTYTEGIFGWRHIDYDFQLKTSLNSNDSRIGGARLIGPRYVLNDQVTTDIYTQYLDNIIPKFTNDNELQNFGEDHHFHFAKVEQEIVPIPCDHNTHIHFETAEDPFATPIDDDIHFNYHQTFYESANFLKSAPGFILNETTLNDHSIYFADEPDHIEEMHVEWDYIFKKAQEENHNEIIFGEKTEQWISPKEERYWEFEHNGIETFIAPLNSITNIDVDLSVQYYVTNIEDHSDIIFGEKSEKWQSPNDNDNHFYIEQSLHESANFLKSAPGFILNESLITDDAIYFSLEPDHIEEMHVEWDYIFKKVQEESIIELAFGEQNNLNFNKVKEIVDIELNANHTEVKSNPIESFTIDHDGEKENVKPRIEELESVNLESDENYEFFNSPFFELNESSISDDYLNGYETDECVAKMFKIVSNEEVIIRVEAI